MMNINPYNDPDDESSNDRVKYFVEDYCKKYPDDRGNQRIYAKDVVRPCNLKWVNQAEQIKWRLSYLGDSHNVGLYYKSPYIWNMCGMLGKWSQLSTLSRMQQGSIHASRFGRLHN
jgi:hypothetical protein